MKTSLVGLFINLRAAERVSASDHIDHGLFATHELADDRINKTLFNERFNSLGYFHGHLCGELTLLSASHLSLSRLIDKT